VKLVGVLIVATALGACALAPSDRPFAHLRADGDTVTATNGVNYGVQGRGFTALTPVHRTDTFNGHPYEISLSGFVGEGFAVMVHAERVADGSGASNYDNLPPATWPTSEFRVRRMCVELEEGDIAGEHDLEWLRSNGFDPAGTLALEQAFVTTPDHNNELVVSLAIEDIDCANEAAVEAALSRVRARLSLLRHTIDQ
jgi:hypothetical protein